MHAKESASKGLEDRSLWGGEKKPQDPNIDSASNWEQVTYLNSKSEELFYKFDHPGGRVVGLCFLSPT